jgi:hypothetical protein
MVWNKYPGVTASGLSVRNEQETVQSMWDTEGRVVGAALGAAVGSGIGTSTTLPQVCITHGQNRRDGGYEYLVSQVV